MKRREAVEAKRRAMGTTIGARLLRACGMGVSEGGGDAETRARVRGGKVRAAMGAAKRGSVRKRIHELGMFAMDRIDPREMTLCGMPREASSMEVAYPRGATDARRARRATREAVETGMKNSARGDEDVCDRGAVVDADVFVPGEQFSVVLFRVSVDFVDARDGGGEGGDGALRLTRARNARRRRGRWRSSAKSWRLVVSRSRARDWTRATASTSTARRVVDSPIPRSRNSYETKDRTRCSCRATPWPRPRAGTKIRKKSAAARVEEIFNETGVVELSRKHRRYDEIYGRGANESVY